MQSKRTQPFFRSEILIGSAKSVDTDWKNVSVTEGKSDNVILTADPIINQRPEVADPFDVRDCLNWIEPEWKLD